MSKMTKNILNKKDQKFIHLKVGKPSKEEIMIQGIIKIAVYLKLYLNLIMKKKIILMR